MDPSEKITCFVPGACENEEGERTGKNEDRLVIDSSSGVQDVKSLCSGSE